MRETIVGYWNHFDPKTKGPKETRMIELQCIACGIRQKTGRELESRR